MADIGFGKEEVPPMLLKFMGYTWMELEKLTARSAHDNVVLVSKKYWVGYAGGIHKLKISIV
jgi:hypothetical protein